MVLLQQVVNSASFEYAVLNNLYKNKRQFVDTILTNDQVLSRFMSGNQNNEGNDFELDVDLTIYQASGNTVGYTYPSTVRTWINRTFFDSYSPAEVAGNLAHEYCHKIGFSHAKWAWPSRKYSVPYAIGYLVQELAEKLSSGKSI